MYIIALIILIVTVSIKSQSWLSSNISCLDQVKKDVLPSAESPKFSPKPDSIFFLETSCRGKVTTRQACCIESAARIHPEKQVYLLFATAVTEQDFISSPLQELMASLPNIICARVHMDEYAKGTPLEEMVDKKPYAKSKWWVSHLSDILRYITLYKWGGIYIDTDMLVVKSLNILGSNWVGREDDILVNPAILSVASKSYLGKRFIESLMSEVRIRYRAAFWQYNGPGAITRVLRRFCNTNNATMWSAATCDGFAVYPYKYFFPIHYSIVAYYFEQGPKLSPLGDNAYTHHFWNRLSFSRIIEEDSPYSRMAKKYCPTVAYAYAKDFGILWV